MQDKILIIDIETTGLSHKNKIVEIGIVELNIINGEKRILFSELCHETGITLKEVENAWIVQNGYITVDEIRHSKNLLFWKPQIQAILDAYPRGATAFNNSFDFGFLINRGFRFTRKLQCPMIFSTPICKLPQRRAGNGFKWPSAQEAYNYFFPSNKYKELHRGADDAFHEAEIVFKLITDYKFDCDIVIR